MCTRMELLKVFTLPSQICSIISSVKQPCSRWSTRSCRFSAVKFTLFAAFPLFQRLNISFPDKCRQFRFLLSSRAKRFARHHWRLVFRLPFIWPRLYKTDRIKRQFELFRSFRAEDDPLGTVTIPFVIHRQKLSSSSKQTFIFTIYAKSSRAVLPSSSILGL